MLKALNLSDQHIHMGAASKASYRQVYCLDHRHSNHALSKYWNQAGKYDIPFESLWSSICFGTGRSLKVISSITTNWFPRVFQCQKTVTRGYHHQHNRSVKSKIGGCIFFTLRSSPIPPFYFDDFTSKISISRGAAPQKNGPLVHPYSTDHLIFPNGIPIIFRWSLIFSDRIPSILVLSQNSSFFLIRQNSILSPWLPIVISNH